MIHGVTELFAIVARRRGGLLASAGRWPSRASARGWTPRPRPAAAPATVMAGVVVMLFVARACWKASAAS